MAARWRRFLTSPNHPTETEQLGEQKQNPHTTVKQWENISL